MKNSKKTLGLDLVEFEVIKLYGKHTCRGSSKSSLRVIISLLQLKYTCQYLVIFTFKNIVGTMLVFSILVRVGLGSTNFITKEKIILSLAIFYFG